MNLLPTPRSLQRRPGNFVFPSHARLNLDESIPAEIATAIAKRLQRAAHEAGVTLTRVSHFFESRITRSARISVVLKLDSARIRAGGYTLKIDQRGGLIEFRDFAGLRAGVATMRQIFREYGRRLPCLKIRDWPDFPRRGVMLDVSRGRVPKLSTLLDLAERLADFKINELQLYTEHTFAYRKYKSVWQSWNALNGGEIHTLAARCRELGIDLVPNQNSFGHLRAFLAHPPLKKLAEVPAPYESDTGDFIRHPTTLAPKNPGTLPFLRGLFDELLPNFSSIFFNVGCDETWDLGRGQSKELCARIGKGRVYLDFLKKILQEVARRDKGMMFWGDIILKYPELIPKLASFDFPPKGGTPSLIALNWGYESDHPFAREAALFKNSSIPFYVCPGTSTWMSLIGRHDNAFANLRAAAKAGREHGAVGYLITDWGDGGHPQPLAVSWLPYLYGASVSWCAKSFDEKKLLPVLSRDVFQDAGGRIARAALALGLAHRRFGYKETNQTPFGTPIAAPKLGTREMICRNGAKCYARIPAKKIRRALAEVAKQLKLLSSAKADRQVGPTRARRILIRELELAARMAAESCHIMHWQQVLAAGKEHQARELAMEGIRRVKQLKRDFNAYWPARNKGTTKFCSPFLQWRMDDYRRGKLHFLPEAARTRQPKFYPAE